ncbi:MAG: hypothetical protein SWZ49_20585 [Cyanobacteriota bacterium]|nr:hypothetical protein [Cyanobacteriota bacterium]
MFDRYLFSIEVATIFLGIAIVILLPIFQARTKWVQEAVISFDGLGRSAIGLAIDGNTIVISTRQSDFEEPLLLRSIYIYTYNGQKWLQRVEVTIPEEKPKEGYRLNSWTAIDGDTILVGANVFTRLGETWSFTTKLQPPSFDNLGRCHSIALDGDTAVISCEYAIHVFRRNRDTGDWFFEAEIKRIYRGGDCYSTGKVGIDGDTIVDGNHVYHRNSTNDWHQEAKLTLNKKTITNISRVRISGNTIVIGMQTRFTDPDGRGTVYIFERNPKTAVWEYKTKLVPHDIVPFAIYGFGASIAIDGSTIIVGHGFDVRNNLAWAWSSWYIPQPKGRAYIFVRNKRGRWLGSVQLRPNNNQPTGGGVYTSGNRVIFSGKDDRKLYIYKRVD